MLAKFAPKKAAIIQWQFIPYTLSNLSISPSSISVFCYKMISVFFDQGFFCYKMKIGSFDPKIIEKTLATK